MSFYTTKESLTDGNSEFARELFELYDLDKDGFLSTTEVEALLKDAYKAMGEFIVPKEKDIEDYIKVLDKNRDGQVSLEDFEKLSKYYMAGITMSTTYTSYTPNSTNLGLRDRSYSTGPTNYTQYTNTLTYKPQYQPKYNKEGKYP